MTLRDRDTGDVLASYVPRLLATWQPPTDIPGWIEVDGTLVSADISGFTALSERLARLGREGAETLTNLLNECFGRMIEAVNDEGGDILKFGGDALLILFSGPDHAKAACRATARMRTIVARPLTGRGAGRIRLGISQGVHSGTFTIYSLPIGHTDIVITGPGATETVACETDAVAGDILLSSDAAAWFSAEVLSDELDHGRRRLERPPPAARRSRRDPDVPTGSVDATRYIPHAQREQVLVGAPAEHRHVTVAFVKFSHTDRLEADGPAALAAHLHRVASIVADSAHVNGVHWMATDIASDGGKIILAAGAPTSSEDDEDRMLRAVRTIIEEAADLDVRVGVHCGPVFVGDLGSTRRRTFTIMGDSVNLAARLMGRAGPGEVVVSKALTDRARSRYELRPLEPFYVKGKSEPITAAMLGRLEGRDATLDRHVLPLIGRRAELAVLDGFVERARSGRGSVVELAGEPGAGKTRLLDEVRQRAALPGASVICGQYARAAPYFVLRLLLRTLSGSTLVTPADEAGAALAAWVARVDPEQLPWLPLIGLVVDAEVAPTPEADRLAPAFRRERTHRAVADLLAAAATAPFMVVIEDVQWMDDASRDALTVVLDALADRPCIVLMTRRPGPALFAGLPAMAHAVINIEPLGPVEALELASAAAGEKRALRPDDWDRLVERSGGNPLFVIELVTAARDGSGDALPDSIEALVTSRLDVLAPADRLLLREASVLGTVIDTEILASALGDDSVRSADRWLALDVFVMTDGERLQFRHSLHRHVAYEGMSYRRRREAHRRVGEAIQDRAGERHEEWAELLATHFDAAGANEPAWRYSRIAAERARAKHANVEAATFYARALDNGRSLRVPPADLIGVAEALGDVSELSGRYDDAARAYRRAAALGVDGRHRAQLMHKEGVVRERTGRYSQALRWYRRGLNLLHDDDESPTEAASLRSELSLAFAGVRYRQGRYREMVRWAEEAATSAEMAGDLASLAHAYYLLDLGTFSLGWPSDERYSELALPIYEQLGDDVGLCNVWNNLGIVDYHAGRWPKALDAYSIACDAAERAGDVVGVATGQNNIGEILTDQGRVDAAVPMFRDALRVFRSAGYPAGVAVAMSNLGWAEVLAGNVATGIEHLERAVAEFDAIGASAFVFSTRVRMVEALVVDSRFEEALELSATLVGALAEEGDDKPKVQLQRARSWALIATGQIAQASVAIDDAVDRAGDALYEQGCNQLVRANLALNGGDPDDAAALTYSADIIFDELGVVGLPRIPWARRGAK